MVRDSKREGAGACERADVRERGRVGDTVKTSVGAAGVCDIPGAGDAICWIMLEVLQAT